MSLLLAGLLLAQDVVHTRLVEKADGAVELRVTRKDANGASTTETFKAASTEEFRAKYPELARRHRVGAPEPFDGVLPSPWNAFVREWFGAAKPLGIRVTALPEALKAQLDVDGLLVTSVDAGGRGACAGLQAHDVLLKVDGAPVGSPWDFRAAVRKAGNGTIKIDLLRRGKPTTVTVEGSAS